MSYEIEATAATPALVIYLIDASASMQLPLGQKRRIDVVGDALSAAFRVMIGRSTKGTRISPRYRVAIFQYGDTVVQRTEPKTIDELARMGPPAIHLMKMTNTHLGFDAVEKLLQEEIPHLQNHPTPLVCHLTDGEFSGEDPEPIARRIMAMSVPDGNVLVENIFISDQVLDEVIMDPKTWPGIGPSTKLKTPYAEKLRNMSSPLPASYRGCLREFGYGLSQDALMFLPGTSPELVSLGFVMSSSTKVR